MKTGLVIQGPLSSPGFGPFEFQSDGSFQKTWIEFDCKVNLHRILKQATQLFDFVTVSTWNDPEYLEFLEEIKNDYGVEVLALQADENLKHLDQLGIHKFHQIFTLNAGVKNLSRKGCDLVAKIRTDHFLDINLMHKEVLRHRHKNRYSLGVPNLNLFETDRLTDFYFVGNPQVIGDMCDAYVQGIHICDDTHKDYFLNFLCFLSGDEDFVRRIVYSSSKIERLYLLSKAWTIHFYPLNRKLFHDFYWRGRKVNHHVNGWIRWFFLFHSKSSSAHVKSLFNLSLIWLLVSLKKPFMRIVSKFVYMFYRRKALCSVVFLRYIGSK